MLGRPGIRFRITQDELRDLVRVGRAGGHTVNSKLLGMGPAPMQRPPYLREDGVFAASVIDSMVQRRFRLWGRYD